MNQKQIADLIERFLKGKVDEWEWDDFISIRLRDPRLDAIRARCANLPKEFPPNQPGEYCAKVGKDVLKQLADSLRE
jgi:hypothetical protein